MSQIYIEEVIIISNIFTTENIAKYNTKGRTVGIGDYVLRNGYWAMDIRPEPFYKNFGDESYCLRDEFLPNTQYIVNVWIDGDDNISGGSPQGCGFELKYTDGTTESGAVIVGGDKGFQHVEYVTNLLKSVKEITYYYYTSAYPIFYRADSFIAPLVNSTTAKKSGIVASSDFAEAITPPISAKFGQGYILGNEFIEW